MALSLDFAATSPSPFLPDSQVQYAWDSTSLGTLKECPRKYYYTMIEGWRKKDTSVHLLFGGWFASALELYHRAMTTKSHDDALDDTVQYLLTETHGWVSDHPKKNKETLIRSVIWYLDEYKEDTAKTVLLPDGRPAVELSFKMEIGLSADANTPYLFCGHLDRVVEYADYHYVLDQKTTGSTLGAYYFRQYNPDNQMSGYTMASGVVFNMPVKGVIVDAAQIAVGFTAFARGFTLRTHAQIDEWLEDTKEWLLLAKYYAQRNAWPMNDKSCHKYDGCPFREVCANDPAVRKNYLETSFEKGRIWNPLTPR